MQFTIDGITTDVQPGESLLAVVRRLGLDSADLRTRPLAANIAGETFTLADVVLGLSVNRWKMTPFDKPAVPAIDAWFERLNQRPAFLRHGNNGMV